ncbi:MAG: PEP-CTERM-box response regulator transcription factor [Nitrospinota bacterium]
MKTKLVIVDDDPGLLSQLRWALQDEYEVELFEAPAPALPAIQAAGPCVVLLDLYFPGVQGPEADGLAAAQKILEAEPLTKVIIITGVGGRQNALSAVELRVYDFLEKPLDLQALKTLVGRASYLQRLEVENRRLQEALEKKHRFENIVGSSPPMQEIFHLLARVADTEATILLEGESGTGKELVAQAIHYRSRKRAGPFVVINCGAIPEELVESELFGHEKGAFTSAHRRHIGKVEQANGGTLFLDEVAELSPRLQVKLLRFLQNHTIERVGGTSLIEVDVRVIAATNKDLEKATAEGAFREDLFFRLNVIGIRIPPVRERGGDILLLADYHLRRLAREKGLPSKSLSPAAREAVHAYAWPGNVRELENRIERALLTSRAPSLTPKDLGLEGGAPRRAEATLREVRERAEEAHLRACLAEAGGNLSRAAKMLGIDRKSLRNLMARYSL